MRGIACSRERRRRQRLWRWAVVAGCLVGSAGGLSRLHAADRPGAPVPRAYAADDATALPDDNALLAELGKAVELRRREDFDRMLDARDPGELVEHATLTEVDFEHRTFGIDTLFIVGDELFGYL